MKLAKRKTRDRRPGAARWRPSPGLLVAALALFIALGGVAYGVAAETIGSRAIKDGSVLSRDVKDGAIRGHDLKNGSVLGRDIKNGTVRSADIHLGGVGSVEVADGSLRGRDLAVGSIGDREIAESGLDVPRLAGIAARRYVRDVKQVRVETVRDARTPKRPPAARCPRGSRLLGGGARVVGSGAAQVALGDNGPRGRSWTASAFAVGADAAAAPVVTTTVAIAPVAAAPARDWQLVVIAICG